MVAALTHGATRHKPETLPPAEDVNSRIAVAREAVRQAEAATSGDHPVMAVMLRNLALVMHEGGYDNYAERYAQQSLAILERHFGPDDVSLVPALNVLAETAVSRHRYADARAWAQRAVSIGPGAGAHYGTALHNLGAVLYVEGDLRGARESYRQALNVRSQLLPPDHPYIHLTRAALEQAERSAKRIARR